MLVSNHFREQTVAATLLAAYKANLHDLQLGLLQAVAARDLATQAKFELEIARLVAGFPVIIANSAREQSTVSTANAGKQALANYYSQVSRHLGLNRLWK